MDHPRKYMARLGVGTPVARTRIREATLDDLGLLVRHRRGMWADISDFTKAELDAADPVYRRWARGRLRSGALVGFVVETARGEAVASSCLWLMPTQPRPGRRGTVAPYLLSMYTEPAHRGRGYATRIVREAISWAKARGYDTMLLHASRFGERIYVEEGFRRTTEMRLRLREPSGQQARRRKRRSLRRGRR